MKPKNSKAKSKRVNLNVKYKTEKKVRDAHRKKARIDKINQLSGKKSKDPGIPNTHPLKDEMIRREMEKKERMESLKIKQKLDRQSLFNSKRKMPKGQSLEQIQQDAAKRGAEFDNVEAPEDDGALAGPGVKETSRAYYKEFRKVVEAADVILQVLDARDPLGCRCRRVEQQVLAAGSDKRLVLVLNKIDLIPKEALDKWLKYLRNDFPTIAFKASTQSQSSHLNQSKFAAVGGKQSGASGCFGARTLISLMANFCRNRDIRTTIRVGVIGYPNVGKSSLINSLKRSKVCGIGATPGVTTVCQEIALDKHVKLIDSPGIVFDNPDRKAGGGASHSKAQAARGSDLVLRNVVRLEDVEDPIPPVTSILERCDHALIMETYGVPEFTGTVEFLQHAARRFGRLKKGGVPDLEAAARAVLQDWNNGKISFYTMPPETRDMSTHVSASVVSTWGKEFDIDSLMQSEAAQMEVDMPAVDDDDVGGRPRLRLACTVPSADEDDNAMEDVSSGAADESYDFKAALGK
eukprot:m.266135 g.266135  ORF g.266135 m.266135 type:complete len:520 (+) comp19718_c0_seq4:125-1684(+)